MSKQAAPANVEAFKKLKLVKAFMNASGADLYRVEVREDIASGQTWTMKHKIKTDPKGNGV